MKLWGVVVVGFLLGLVGGLIVTWFVVPLEYYDTYPPMMDAAYRQDWARMVAWSYALEGDWQRTQTRLVDLAPAEVRVAASDVLEQAIAGGRSATVLQRLAELAAAYGASSPAVSIYVQDGSPPEIVATPLPEPTATRPVATSTTAPMRLPTATPRPTLTPTMTASAPITDAVPLRVISQTLTCDPAPFIAVSLTLSRTVEVRGREQQEIVELPMREVWLIWSDGADRAITGFQPEKGLGYADFEVVPGRSYNLYVDSPHGIPIRTLQVEPCPPAEGTGWVSRHLILQEEEVAEEEDDPGATPAPTMTLGLTPTLTITATVTATGVLTMTATPTATLTAP